MNKIVKRDHRYLTVIIGVVAAVLFFLSGMYVNSTDKGHINPYKNNYVILDGRGYDLQPGYQLYITELKSGDLYITIVKEPPLLEVANRINWRLWVKNWNGYIEPIPEIELDLIPEIEARQKVAKIGDVIFTDYKITGSRLISTYCPKCDSENTNRIYDTSKGEGSLAPSLMICSDCSFKW